MKSGLFALCSLVFPSVSWAQGLVGDQVDIRPFLYPNPTTVTVVDPGVELVGAGPILGLAGPNPRFDIDISPISIRMDFVEPQTVDGAGRFLTFEELDPVCPNGQIGQVVGVTVTTNIDPNRVFTGAVTEYAWQGGVSWTADSVTIEYVDRIRFMDGDIIELDLSLDCSVPVEPNLDASGVCPGVVQVSLLDMTPGGSVAVVKGGGVGSSVIPVGPCAGTALDLASPSLITVITDNDSDGAISVSPTVGAPVCGQPIQMVDLATCSTSNVIFMP